MADFPLQFAGVPMEMDGGALTLDVPAHQAVSLLADESSGIERLGPFALGLEPAGNGRALVYGEDISLLPRRQALAFRRRVGYLPAGDGLIQNLSLRDNIALPLRFGSDLGDHEIDGRVKVMLAMVRLSNAGHLRPAAVTEEQRRRAAIARALAFDPALVILQQPFAGLTHRTAAELLEIARGGETAEGSRRTVFVTGQDLPDILRPRFETRYRIVKGQLQRDS